MANVNFLFRSTKENAPLVLRLLYRYENKDFVFGAKTQLEVSKHYWEKEHNQKRPKDIEVSNKQVEINKELNNIKNHILKAFQNIQPDEVNKDWLNQQLENYYNPQQEVEIPNSIVSFIDYYLNVKNNDLTEARKKRISVTKRKLVRFEQEQVKEFKIIEINDIFKKLFVDYCNEEQYSINTTAGDISIIKTICRYAKQCNIEIHNQLEYLKVKEESTEAIYLSFDELEQIKSLDLSNNDRLYNVRDWLIISCYTGQRISDFMRFVPSMIEKRQGKYLLSFIQQKTNKKITIPLLEEAHQIVDKNNGSFPRPLSHQKYNEYLKELCELAGINEMIEGTILERVAESKNKTRNDYRKRNGIFEKWKLVSSHVGRRSFATNYYGKIPTSVLIGITGHSTEKMFLTYIRKTETDTAIEAFEHFEKR
jgi:integrase